MEHKGKRAEITQKNLADIMSQALAYPRIPRTELAEKIQETITWKGSTPEVEVLERKISWFRNHAKDGPQENQWSMAALEDYPLPSAALSAVLAVWKLKVESGSTFTIREAKWVSRLYELKKDTKALSFIARRYAQTELIYEILKQPFNSTDLDRLLMGLPVELKGEEDLFPFLAEQNDGVEQLRNSLKKRKRNVAKVSP